MALCCVFCYHDRMASQLEKSILAAVAYFDIFDYPLTLIEIHRFVLNLSGSFEGASLFEARDCLERSQFLKDKIHFKNGFFYLRGSDKIIKIRHERYIIAKQKFDRAREIISMLARAPFVRAIFVCNSLAFNNAKKESDIDLVIITKKGGVWLSRLFCLLLLSMMRIRPGYKNTRNKICLSMFMDENHLDFSHLKMGKRDIDFMYWVLNFYALYDSRGLYKKFWNANKDWLKQNMPNASLAYTHSHRYIKAKPRLRVIVEYVLRPFSIIAESIQRAKFPSRIRDIMNQDTRVRVEDGLLKFHVNDKRLEHLEAFVKKYEKVMQ